MLTLILTELNDVAFGILTVTHAIILKIPLPLRWEEVAAMLARHCSGRREACNFKDKLHGCLDPAPWRTFNFD